LPKRGTKHPEKHSQRDALTKEKREVSQRGSGCSILEERLTEKGGKALEARGEEKARVVVWKQKGKNKKGRRGKKNIELTPNPSHEHNGEVVYD